MVRQLTYAIVGDGGTDRSLQPLIERSVRLVDPGVEILEPDFTKRSGSVIEAASQLGEGSMLVFIHRDAESASMQSRLAEFAEVEDERVIPLIPVRMTEAWLLVDAMAIAKAAGRPSATVTLPPWRELESIPNPKSLLEQLLLSAAGNPSGRRRDQFERRMTSRRVSVASYISDFTTLDRLPSYSAFLARLQAAYPYGRA